MRSSIQTINGFSEIGKLCLFFIYFSESGKLYMFFRQHFLKLQPCFNRYHNILKYLSVGNVTNTLCYTMGTTKNTPVGFGRHVSFFLIDSSVLIISTQSYNYRNRLGNLSHGRGQPVEKYTRSIQFAICFIYSLFFFSLTLVPIISSCSN